MEKCGVLGMFGDQCRQQEGCFLRHYFLEHEDPRRLARSKGVDEALERIRIQLKTTETSYTECPERVHVIFDLKQLRDQLASG